MSPVNADLSLLSPLLIWASSDEILLNDSMRLAERTREAGVDTILDVGENMWHVWHFIAGKMPEAKESQYWLKLSSPIKSQEYLKSELMCECEELQKIFGAIIRNTKL
jgi:acetyl esterase/lipase